MFNTASVPARNDLRFQSICVQKKTFQKHETCICSLKNSTVLHSLKSYYHSAHFLLRLTYFVFLFQDFLASFKTTPPVFFVFHSSLVFGFSREREPTGHVKTSVRGDLLEELAYLTAEPQDLPRASRRGRDCGDVIQTESEGLRTGSTRVWGQEKVDVSV